MVDFFNCLKCCFLINVLFELSYKKIIEIILGFFFIIVFNLWGELSKMK